MYPQSSISHIVLLAATSLSRICMDVCILLISKQLLQMRFRWRNKASDRHFKQAAEYVVVTCILFHTCFVEYMLVLILRVLEYFGTGQISGFDYLALVSIMLNSCFRILNILTVA